MTETLLFKIDGHPVTFQPGYGVVAIGLWTTNGHYGCAARLTANWVQHGSKITDSALPKNTDFSDADSVFRAFKVACGH